MPDGCAAFRPFSLIPDSLRNFPGVISLPATVDGLHPPGRIRILNPVWPPGRLIGVLTRQAVSFKVIRNTREFS